MSRISTETCCSWIAFTTYNAYFGFGLWGVVVVATLMNIVFKNPYYQYITVLCASALAGMNVYTWDLMNKCPIHQTLCLTN